MDQWDVDYLELDGRPFIRIGLRGSGNLHFGAVDGVMDHRLGERDGQPLIEFSREGADEEDPVSGRGWATVDGDRLTGRIFFYQGEESGFVATRDGANSSTRGRARRTG